MQAMCDDVTFDQEGWAIGVADCDGVVTLEYFDVDGVSLGGTLPAGWRTCVQGVPGPTWSPTQETLTFATPTNIDFSNAAWYKTLSINGNLTLTASNYAVATELNIRIVETGASSRTLTFPATWVWVTTMPTALAANKTALLNLISYGTTEANVVARWWVQA
jgi:hypothetical protein